MTGPTHLLPSSDATATLCGIRRRDRDAYPYVLVDFAPMHIAGRGMVPCPACVNVRLETVLADTSYVLPERVTEAISQ